MRTSLLVAALLVTACSSYAPTLVDCSLHCSDQGACPTGTTCESGFCRPAGATGACDCAPGDQRPCGGGKGECVPGVQTCGRDGTWLSACLGEGTPTAEVCDGKDNDCDGVVDNAPTDLQPCSLTVGVCAGAKRSCIAGAQPACTAANYGASYEASEVSCDGLDNDCDGETDVTQPVVVSRNVSHEWFVFGYPGGYAAIYTEPTTLGAHGDDVFVVRYDEALTPLGPPRLLLAASRSYFGASNVGPWLYFVAVRDAAEALSVDPDGGLTTFAPFGDAGFSATVRAGASDGLSAVYVAGDNGELARLVRWSLDGGLAQVVDLNGDDAGTLTQGAVSSINVSRDGRYAVFGASALTLSDGGVTGTGSLLSRTSDGQLLRRDAPTCGGNDGALLSRGGALLAGYSDISPQESGVYFSPDLRSLTDADRLVVQHASNGATWGASDGALLPDGGVVLVMQDKLNARLLLARGSGTAGSSWVSAPVLAPTAYGTPRLAVSSDGSRVGLATLDLSTATVLKVRRVCVP
jgi:hypothetical protein